MWKRSRAHPLPGWFACRFHFAGPVFASAGHAAFFGAGIAAVHPGSRPSRGPVVFRYFGVFVYDISFSRTFSERAISLLGRRRALWGAVLIIVLTPFVRFATWRYFPAWTPGIKWQFQTVCDSLATGCLLAGCQGWLARPRGLDKLLASNALLLLPI